MASRAAKPVVVQEEVLAHSFPLPTVAAPTMKFGGVSLAFWQMGRQVVNGLTAEASDSVPRGTRRAGACLIPAFGVVIRLSRSNRRLAGNSKTPDTRFGTKSTMSNINPNCDGSRYRHSYREVSLYPLRSGGDLRLSPPCFASENLDRYKRAKEAGHPKEARPQVSWAIAEVIFDKYGEPFDAEAVIRQGIINYHKSCE